MRQIPRVQSATLSHYASVQVHFSFIPHGPINFPLSFLYASWAGHRDSVTGQRLLPSSVVYPPPLLKELPKVGDSGDLLLEWQSRDGSPVVARYDCNWLLKHGSGLGLPAAISSTTKTSTSTTRLTKARTPLRIGYDELMLANDIARKELILSIAAEDIAIVCSHPARDAESGAVVAAQIAGALSRGAPPMRSMYGDMWVVRDEQKPINIAYTSQELEFHQDLIYQESPPLAQILCATKFDSSVSGGESTFVDAFAVAEELSIRDPESFDTLSKLPTTWEKAHKERPRPYLLSLSRPIFELTSAAALVAVRWSPPFEGVLRGIGGHDMDRYFKAYHSFARLLEDVKRGRLPGLIELRLKPGEAVVFNNRSLLHGRRAFKGNGKRELVGAYVSSDEFSASLAELSSSLPPCRGIGNYATVSPATYLGRFITT
jgi:alpha-ketoglutarate-dependent taurine dioxygenase